jgi:hypothetical protein
MRSVVFPVGPAGGAERSEERVLRFMRTQKWNATDLPWVREHIVPHGGWGGNLGASF